MILFLFLGNNSLLWCLTDKIIVKNIQNIQSPVLIFQGENDEFGTMKQVEKIKANVKSKVIDYLISDCGHNPHKEQKEFTLEKTNQFIRAYALWCTCITTM